MTRHALPPAVAINGVKARVVSLLVRCNDRMTKCKNLLTDIDRAGELTEKAVADCSAELAALNAATSIEVAAEILEADALADYTVAQGLQMAAEMNTNAAAMAYATCLSAP